MEICGEKEQSPEISDNEKKYQYSRPDHKAITCDNSFGPLFYTST